MKKLLIASALLAASATANAAVYTLDLTAHLIGRAGNSPSASLINPAPSFGGDTGNIPEPVFYYDDVTGIVSSSGITHLRSQTNPTVNGRVFDRYFTDLTIDIVNGNPNGTTAYLCENAPGTSQAAGFGAIVGANICGNYTLGGNFADNSTMTYGPGLAFNRVLGGDDVSSGPPQSINDYQLFFASFTGVGGELVIQSSNWNPTSSAGTQMRFNVTAVQVIPVPAAVWLFGSALGLLGVARRRLAA